jgi:glycosyltransferase involved in cell wall biosynthesis
MIMKILFQSRKTLFTVPGGDTVQLLKTKEYLEKMDIKIDISLDLEPDLSSYDLVHVFNLMRPQEVYLQVRNAKKHSKPVALSTIYGLYTEYEKKARRGLPGGLGKVLNVYQIEYLKVIARGVLNKEINKGTFFLLKSGYLSLQKQICSLTDVFLPNSESEMKRVEKDMGLTNYMHVTVPNAVDISIFNPDRVTISQNVEEYKDCVLCVARIEGRKNQLNLVRAMKGLPWKLVLIGNPAPNHLAYYKSIKKEAGKNVHILGHVNHELLPQFYKAARVHALISWMETPGLSSLEAGAMGCNLVITGKGDTRYYFEDYAHYCEPDSVDSIRNAVIQAYESSSASRLREHIIQKFTWEKSAQKTFEGYMQVLHA